MAAGQRRGWVALAATLMVIALAGCGGASASGPGGAAGGSGTSSGGETTAIALSSPQGCIGPGAEPGSSTVAWRFLRNPILSDPAISLKDEAIRLYHHVWHMVFSALTGNPLRWTIGTATSTDLQHWSSPQLWPPQAGTLGIASPDLLETKDATFIVTYTSIPGQVGGGQAKLYYRTSKDLASWSSPLRLASNIFNHRGDRLIDPALAQAGKGLILGFKSGVNSQHFQIAYSPSGSPSGPWRYVGQPDVSVYGGTIENYQFTQVNGIWYMVATSNQLDQPWMFTLAGPPGRPESWLRWNEGRELQVPNEAWEQAPGVTGVSYEHANSAYLCDARSVDGYFYLLFSGNNDMTLFAGSGHNSIGVARSTDLVHWQVPPG